MRCLHRILQALTNSCNDFVEMRVRLRTRGKTQGHQNEVRTRNRPSCDRACGGRADGYRKLGHEAPDHSVASIVLLRYRWTSRLALWPTIYHTSQHHVRRYDLGGAGAHEIPPGSQIDATRFEKGD